MKTLGKLLYFVPVLLLLFLSCSDEAEDIPDEILVKTGDFRISSLVGNWEATTANFSDGIHNVDLIGEGGSASMSVNTTGIFTLTISPAERRSYTLSGEMYWQEWEGEYYFAIVWDNYPDEWNTYEASLNSSTFTISGGFDTGEYDFNYDGAFESCSICFTFIRGASA